MLKRNNNGIGLPEDLLSFWDESLLGNKFFQNQNNNKKEGNINNKIDSDKNNKENIEISTLNKNLEKNSDNDSDKEKNIIAEATIRYLENRLKSLQLDNVDNEKQIWKKVVDSLAKKKIITYEHKKKFYNKLNSVCDVNGFVSVLQWLGCVLLALVPITLFSDKIRNRISHPINRRVFEYLKEHRNDLFSPLQEGFDDDQKKDDMMI